MERVIDPLIADLQREHGEALRTGRIWKGRWIQFGGWIAFLKVIALCAWHEMTSPDRWPSEDRRSLTRAALISVLTAAGVTVLLVSMTAEDIPQVLMRPSPVRLLYLAPYPFAAGIVLGATLGVVLGLGGRAISRRLVTAALAAALATSAVAFVDLGWVAPAAHVAYRATIGDTNPNLEIGEASFGALRRKIEQVDRDSGSSPLGFSAALSFDYHRRVALSFSPLVFTLFALALAGCVRRRWLLGLAACAAFLVYGWLVMTVRPWDLQPWDLRAPAYRAAWLPNTAIATLAAICGLLGVARQATRRHRAA
jgi:hypothetical protein